MIQQPVEFDESTHNRRKVSIDRMKKFYESKIPVAPDKQGILFENFVSALDYALECMEKVKEHATIEKENNNKE